MSKKIHDKTKMVGYPPSFEEKEVEGPTGETANKVPGIQTIDGWKVWNPNYKLKANEYTTLHPIYGRVVLEK